VGRILKRRLAALALMTGLVAGGAVVAVAASGSGTGSTDSAKHGHSSQLMQTAAGYLGISRERLQAELQAGQTLGEIAVALGKPEAALLQALGHVASAKLEQRVANGHTPKSKHSAQRAHPLRAAAAGYLGISLTALTQQLRTGTTLAQIADATPGRSAEGLIDTLVQVRLKSAPPVAAKTKKAAATASASRLARLRRHITTFVRKSRGSHKQPKSHG
jgi:imidazolonepropionase-like amidohydrolase